MTANEHLTIVAFCGPSGSGKSELVRGLLESYTDNLVMWPQVTTRKRRNEKDAYIFVSNAQYETMRDILTCRTKFNGCNYGTIPEEIAKPLTAVLTIADAVGLNDLINDVKLHNHQIANGMSPGKFGSIPVKLVTGLIYYEPTEESIAERGRTSRGLDSIKNELTALEATNVNFDFKINTTGNVWPKFDFVFNEHIWPAITFVQNPVEELVQTIDKLIGATATLLSVSTFDNSSIASLENVKDIAEKLFDAINNVPKIDKGITQEKDIPAKEIAVDTEVPATISGNDDDIFEILDKVVEVPITSNPVSDNTPDDGSAIEYTSDALNDAQSVFLVEELEKNLEEDDLPKVDIEERATEVAEETTVDTAASEKDAPKVIFKNALEIFSTNDLTDYILDNSMGLQVFEESNFGNMIRMFIQSNGGNTGDITNVSSQENGTIREFTVHIRDGGVFKLEYNTVLKRPVNFFTTQ